MGNLFGRSPPEMNHQDDQNTRFARSPTHNAHIHQGDNLFIGYEEFQFRGGAPPYRGYHWAFDGQLRIPSNLHWIQLFNHIKMQLDPRDRYDLRVVIYQNSESPIEVESNFRYPTEYSVLEAFTQHNYHLRVLRPMEKGMVDIGIFVPVQALTISSKEKASLTHGEVFDPSQLVDLITSFQRSRPLCNKFQLLPPLEKLSIESLERLKEHADRVHAEKHLLSSDEAKDSHAEGTDLQINMSREGLVEFIGEAAIKDLDELFGRRCEDIVLRRCDKKDHCIDFHVDYAWKTIQIALVDASEYEGGRMVYVVEGGKLEIPERKRGWITVHDNGVIHGVTGLRKGVRYGLLIVDRAGSSLR